MPSVGTHLLPRICSIQNHFSRQETKRTGLHEVKKAGKKSGEKGGNRQLLVAKNVILRRNKPKFETIDNEQFYLFKIGNLPFLW